VALLALIMCAKFANLPAARAVKADQCRIVSFRVVFAAALADQAFAEIAHDQVCWGDMVGGNVRLALGKRLKPPGRN